jgi:hypothetical protein
LSWVAWGALQWVRGEKHHWSVLAWSPPKEYATSPEKCIKKNPYNKP